jgi:hypothetical protein
VEAIVNFLGAHLIRTLFIKIFFQSGNLFVEPDNVDEQSEQYGDQHGYDYVYLSVGSELIGHFDLRRISGGLCPKGDGRQAGQ